MGDEVSNIVCPKCGGNSVDVQVVQENQGSRTKTHTKSKYKETGHGCLWWLVIGWWWWIVDLILWLFFFVPRLILRLFAAPFKKRRYVGESTTVSKTDNKIRYQRVFVCKGCGHYWKG